MNNEQEKYIKNLIDNICNKNKSDNELNTFDCEKKLPDIKSLADEIWKSNYKTIIKKIK